MSARANLFSGDTFEVRGRSFRVTFEHDDSMDAPWEDDCGRGIVGDCYKHEKRPGWVILAPTGKRDVWHYYDVAGTMERARRDGWGLSEYSMSELRAKHGREPTKGEVLAESVCQDMEFIRAWLNDDWEYVGVIVELLDKDGEGTGREESLWGVEGPGYSYDGNRTEPDYAVTVAYDLAGNILADMNHERAMKAKETRERHYWAARGVETRT